jgi:transcriptional regulator with XRE-family HTH domain
MARRIAINCSEKNPTLLEMLGRLSIMTKATKSESSREIIARNVKLLRKQCRWSQSVLGKKAGVGQRTISNIENPKTPTTPTIDRVEAVAQVFGLELCHIAMPMPLDVLIDIGGLARVIGGYAHATPSARKTVEQVAEIASDYVS